MTVSLLPSNATPLERAFSLASAEQPRLPVHLLASIYDPLTCPARLLPFLAWAFSVDLWKEDWPEAKRRAVIAASPVLHRLKGTRPGLERHLAFVGAKLVQLRQPPQTYMPDAPMTKAEREAYLARFRQIRVYPYRSRGKASFQAYANSGYRRSRLFLDGGYFPATSDAIGRVGRRSFLFDPLTGIETPIQRVVRETVTETREATSSEQFALSGKAGPAFFLDRKPLRKTFTFDTGARSRLFSMEIRQAYDHRSDVLHLTGVVPSLTPIDVRPRKVAERGRRGFGRHFPPLGGKATEFLGRAGDGRFRFFLPPTTANTRIYDQVHLLDADRMPDKRHARTFMDAGCHFGLPAHNLVARVELRGRQSRFAFGRFMAGYMVETDKSALADTITAARVSKAAYEKLLLTTKTRRPATVSDRLEVGSVAVGQWIKV